MIRFLRKLRKDRRGNALVIAGASLPLIVAAAGLGTDTIQWVLWRRQLQRAADSAAIAAVHQIAQDEGDRTNIVSAADRDLGVNNHVGITTTRTVGQPTSGVYASDPYAVQVTLAIQKRLAFSSMFLSSTPVVSTTATATVVPDGEYCAISLIDTASTGISAGGSTNLNLGCGMITNSTSLTAAVAFGSSSVTASPVAAVGGIDANDNWGAGTILQPFTLAQPDPFGDVDAPTPSGCQTFSALGAGNNNKPGNTINLTGTLTAGGTYCIKENGGTPATLDIKANVILPSGTYILDSTSLSMTNTGAGLTCHDCTFILTSSSASTNPSSIGSINLNGGFLDLKAPDTGTYAGLMFYQDRRAGTGSNVINGNSSSFVQGAAYFPKQNLTFNGTAGMNSSCLQLVALTLTFTGSSAISNSCPAGSGSHAFAGQKVRLVA
jgi:Flp pilus assembly protein TadG